MVGGQKAPRRIDSMPRLRSAQAFELVPWNFPRSAPYLSLMDTIVDIIRSERPSVQLIYLFGSRVDGRANRASDHDIAVLDDGPIDPVERWELAQRLARALDADVDLVDLATASTVLTYLVAITGRCLYAAPQTDRDAWAMNALTRYVQLNLDRRPVLERIAQTGQIHG